MNQKKAHLLLILTFQDFYIPSFFSVYDIVDMFKKIMEGGSTTKKVENFLGGNQLMAMHDYEKDPELRKTLMEIINTPGYDPDSVREAQRQIIRMNQGLPRFPGV